jgi:hypothetical protein
MPNATNAYSLASEYGAVQLIALWDGSGGGGRGGTSDFVERARRISDREPEIIDPKSLSDSSGTQ